MHVPPGFWAEYRLYYREITNLILVVDTALSKIILISISNNLFFICVQLLRSLEWEGMKRFSVEKRNYFYFAVTNRHLRTHFTSGSHWFISSVELLRFHFIPQASTMSQKGLSRFFALFHGKIGVSRSKDSTKKSLMTQLPCRAWNFLTWQERWCWVLRVRLWPMNWCWYSFIRKIPSAIMIPAWGKPLKKLYFKTPLV